MITTVKNIDLITEICKYDVILVGTNTYHKMGNGFQRKVRVNYPETYQINTATKYGDKNKLGTRITTTGNPIFSLCFIVNGYNFRPDLNPDYLDYDSLEECIKTANIEFSGLKVATTIIGCSKYDGNGNVDKVMEILNRNSDKIDLFIYDYVQLDKNIEDTIQYLNIVKNKANNKEKKMELINDIIEGNKKLTYLDNPAKRLARIRDEVKTLLKNN